MPGEEKDLFADPVNPNPQSPEDKAPGFVPVFRSRFMPLKRKHYPPLPGIGNVPAMVSRCVKTQVKLDLYDTASEFGDDALFRRR